MISNTSSSGNRKKGEEKVCYFIKNPWLKFMEKKNFNYQIWIPLKNYEYPKTKKSW